MILLTPLWWTNHSYLLIIVTSIIQTFVLTLTTIAPLSTSIVSIYIGNILAMGVYGFQLSCSSACIGYALQTPSYALVFTVNSWVALSIATSIEVCVFL